MTKSKRIFISFAVEDKIARDNLVNQAKQQESAQFDFTDMSGKDPADAKWKAICREEIKSCDGVIAFISRNTPESRCACWEIKCAREEGIPIMGFWVHKGEPFGKPIELGSTPVVNWNWDTVSRFIHSLPWRSDDRPAVPTLEAEKDEIRLR
jgi:hypothetical protein